MLFFRHKIINMIHLMNIMESVDDMKAGLNSIEMQKNNRALVFKSLLEEPMTRAELATNLGLQKGTITNIINDFLEIGIVAVNGDAAAGRRGEKLTLKLDGMYVLVACVTRKDYQVALYTLDGKEINRIKYTFEEKEELRDIVRKFSDECNGFIKKYGDKNIFDICVAVPGLYIRNNEDGKEIYKITEFEGWNTVNFRKEIECNIGRKIEIVHDAKLAALAEWNNAYEVKKNRNASLIIIRSRGFGIGAGIIINGKIVEGQLGIAGEIGHMGIHYNSRTEKDGTYEAMAGTESAAIYIRERLHEFPESTLNENSSYYEIKEAYINGDKLAIYAINKMAWMLGYGISNIIYILNPDCIILGSDYPEDESFMENVKKVISKYVPQEVYETASIRFSKLKEDPFLFGGYYYLLNKMQKENSIFEKISNIKDIKC